MLDVAEQLRRYGDGVGQRWEDLELPRPEQPGGHRRHWLALVAITAAAALIAVTVVAAMNRSDGSRVAAPGHGQPVYAKTETLTFRQRATGMTMLDGVIADIQNACGSADIVKTVVRLPKGAFSTTTDCGDSAALASEAIEQRLVRRAGRFNDAVAKAAVVERLENALQSELGYEVSPSRVSQLIWSFAIGSPETCRRATDREQIQASMAAVADRETPERWTLIEAVLLAGACPNRLEDLYANVEALGHPEAAMAVRAKIDAAME